MHYEEGQVLIQSGTGLTHALKRWASVIVKWDTFDAYIMHQEREKKERKKENAYIMKRDKYYYKVRRL